MTYKFAIGQRVIDMNLREGNVVSRFTSLTGKSYTVRDDSKVWEVPEVELFKVEYPEPEPTPKPKYERGDWVAHRLYGAGYVEDSFGFRYTIYIPELGVRNNVPEDQLTKIEHDFRPGDRVTFKGWASTCGQYTVTGEVTKLTSVTGVDIRDDKSKGIYGREFNVLTKLAKPFKSDLPMPPKFDTLKTRTVTTTFTNIDPEAFKLLTGWDIPKDSLTMREAKTYLDTKIKRAELDLKKQQDDLDKLKAARRAL